SCFRREKSSGSPRISRNRSRNPRGIPARPGLPRYLHHAAGRENRPAPTCLSGKDPGDMSLLSWLRTKSRKIAGKTKKEKQRRSPWDRAPLALEALEDRITPTTPPIISGTLFAAQTFDQIGFLPPDPSGAAGPNHLVAVVNSQIAILNKTTGTILSQTELTSFFGRPASAFVFDPKVLYDQYNSRFAVVALEQDDSPQTSFVHVAVSNTSDPTGTWNVLHIDSKLTISGAVTWADYPGFAVSPEALYVTTNQFSFSTGISVDSRLFIINKTPFYSGGAGDFTINDADPDGQVFTLQPAHMFGTPPDGTGTFLVSSGLQDGSLNDFFELIRVDDPLGTRTFTRNFV